MPARRLRAAEMFHETFPDEADDGAGRLLRAARFPTRSKSAGAFPSWRRRATSRCASTPTGGRYLEGLDPASSYAVLERFSPESIRGYRSEEELRYLVGTGVSAAAIFHLRAELDRNGFDKVKIVASSGFGPAKCRIMAEAKAPIDVVGIGLVPAVQLVARPTPPPTSSSTTARSA